MITFSIITCTYNAESVLKRTLHSVLEQTYPYVEHIILDGASEDHTMDMVDEYLHEDKQRETRHQIVISSEPDGGLYFAMNKAIKKSTGTYLVFLNAGDVFPASDTLEVIANSIGDGEALPGVIYGDTDIVDEDGHFLRHRRLTPPEKLSWKSFKYGMLVCHQSFYAQTNIAKDVLYNTNYRYSADVDWCIRIMKVCKERNLKLKYVHHVFTNYLDGGMSIKNHRASLEERFRVMQSHYGWITTVMMHIWFVLRSLIKK